MASQTHNLDAVMTGTTAKFDLTVPDAQGTAVDMTGGSVSVKFVPRTGTGSSFTIAGSLDAAPSTAPQCNVTIPATQWSTSSITTPTVLQATATYTTSGGTVYKDYFTVRVVGDDTEWTLGLAMLSEAKSYLKVDDKTDDFEIAELIQAATKEIKDAIGREFVSATYTHFVDGMDAKAIIVPETPIASITKVEIDSGSSQSTISSDSYTFDADSGVIQFRGGESALKALWDTGQDVSHQDARFPDGFRGIKVTYVGGYAAVPADLKQECLTRIADLWHERGRDSGMQSEGLGTYNYTRRTADEASASLARLAARYRVYN